MFLVRRRKRKHYLTYLSLLATLIVLHVGGAITAAEDEPLQRSLADSSEINGQRGQSAIDWDQAFQKGGSVSEQLQLVLLASNASYTYGKTFQLYIGLKNYSEVDRSLEDLPACGSLSRCETLVFNVVGSDGRQLTVANSFLDRHNKHIHPPLQVGKGGMLTGVIELQQLVTSSGKLFDIVESSKSLTITAEVPALNLSSNAVTIQVEK